MSLVGIANENVVDRFRRFEASICSYATRADWDSRPPSQDMYTYPCGNAILEINATLGSSAPAGPL